MTKLPAETYTVETLTAEMLKKAAALLQDGGPRWETLYVPESYLVKLEEWPHASEIGAAGIVVQTFPGGYEGEVDLGLLVAAPEPGSMKPPESRIVRLP